MEQLTRIKYEIEDLMGYYNTLEENIEQYKKDNTSISLKELEADLDNVSTWANEVIGAVDSSDIMEAIKNEQ